MFAEADDEVVVCQNSGLFEAVYAFIDLDVYISLFVNKVFQFVFMYYFGW